MEISFVGFRVSGVKSLEGAFGTLGDAIRAEDAVPIRHWRAADRAYVVVEGSPDARELHSAVRDSIELLGVARVELPGSAVTRLPGEIDQDIDFPPQDGDAIEFNLKICPGCTVELPASEAEHLARHCSLFEDRE